jgi:hypothetical protein
MNTGRLRSIFNANVNGQPTIKAQWIACITMTTGGAFYFVSVKVQHFIQQQHGASVRQEGAYFRGAKHAADYT